MWFAGVSIFTEHGAPALDILLEQRVVVLQKELQKLLLLPPLHLVVILHRVRLVRRGVRRRALREQRMGHHREENRWKDTLHQMNAIVFTPEMSNRLRQRKFLHATLSSISTM